MATPESLGKECCECWKESHSIKNETKMMRKNDECYGLTRSNMRTLQEMGVDGDWDEKKIKNAQTEFDRAYEACK